MNKTILALGASLAVMTTAGAANAATYVYTYEGVVENGIDNMGLFSAVGTDLTGMDYIATYTVTYPVAGAYENITATHHDYGGGSLYNAPTVMTGSLMINGTSVFNDGNQVGRLLKRDENGYNLNQIYANIEERSAQGNFTTFAGFYSNLYSLNNDIINSLEFDELINYTFVAGEDTQVGGYNLWTYDNLAGAYVASTSGLLNPNSVSVSVLGAVPEPSTWAFMIFGFGAIGGAMRRQRKANVKISYA